MVADASARWRVYAALFAVFGLAALAIALIGLYGVVSYTLIQRKAEIAIRVALASSYPAIIRLILQYVAFLGGIGAGLGVLVAVGAGGMIRTLLYGVEPLDLASLGISTGGFLALALVSGLLAASKVTAISPALALKSE